MPLKHSTETALVLFLGALLVLTGIAIAFLPSLADGGMVWWIIAFILSLAYPLALYPLLRDKRADYEFRALHFVPALLLLLWLALEVGSTYWPMFGILQAGYTWGGALVAVAAAFALLMLYCASVIRQSGSRIAMLATLLVPFLLLGILGEQVRWGTDLTAFLRGGKSGTGVQIAVVPSSQSNLSASAVPEEELWRKVLRRMERRNTRIAERAASGTELRGAKDSALLAATGLPQKPDGKGGNGNPPPHLTSSGPGIEFILPLFFALYCGVLQRRAIGFA